jgi:hypothetical protein
MRYSGAPRIKRPLGVPLRSLDSPSSPNPIPRSRGAPFSWRARLRSSHRPHDFSLQGSVPGGFAAERACRAPNPDPGQRARHLPGLLRVLRLGLTSGHNHPHPDYFTPRTSVANQEVVRILSRGSSADGFPANWQRKFDCSGGCRQGRTASCIAIARSHNGTGCPRKWK